MYTGCEPVQTNRTLSPANLPAMLVVFGSIEKSPRRSAQDRESASHCLEWLCIPLPPSSMRCRRCRRETQDTADTIPRRRPTLGFVQRGCNCPTNGFRQPRLSALATSPITSPEIASRRTAVPGHGPTARPRVTGSLSIDHTRFKRSHQVTPTTPHTPASSASPHTASPIPPPSSSSQAPAGSS